MRRPLMRRQTRFSAASRPRAASPSSRASRLHYYAARPVPVPSIPPLEVRALNPPRRRAASLVAIGILASRVFGLIRQRIIAHYLGQATFAADAFYAAFRIPNFLQNLFGEGVLSASMIPEYTRLVAAGREKDARHLAGAVGGLLGALVLGIVAIGVTAAPVLVDVIVPGFHGPRRELAITLVRILFPGVGALVFSAWCLAILNSHRRFLLSYTAPVIWNVTIIIATLIPSRHATGEQLVIWTAWGAVAGSVLQFAVQLPAVWKLTGGVRLSLDTKDERVRKVLGNFAPVFLSRGVVQISGFIDAMIASVLPLGAVAVISNSQTLYLLPVSLFAMSVAAAELPELSEEAGDSAPRTEALRTRIAAGSERIAFFIIPSAVAFVALGHWIAGILLQSGRFSQADSYWVWATLAGSSVGMLAGSIGRLLTSTYYALNDIRTPLKYAVVRVALTLVLGLAAALWLPKLLHIDTKWGTCGLTASAGVAGWIEFALLRRTLRRRIGDFSMPAGLVPRLWGAALVAALAAWGLSFVVTPDSHGALVRTLSSALLLGVFGASYLGLTAAMRVGEAQALLRRVRRRA